MARLTGYTCDLARQKSIGLQTISYILCSNLRNIHET